ncbi:MAG: metal-dependent hydrolase [Thermoplasmata archaeon]|nr:metal-dependent hydrolase [Thermoplasmata archaeon]
MRKHGHMFVGVIFFVLVILAFDHFNIMPPYWILPLYFFITIMGSRMPDWIEPSSRGGYRHRGFFHSRVMLVCLLVVGVVSYFYAQDPWYHAPFFFVLGYISHLLADSTSKMGLP